MDPPQQGQDNFVEELGLVIDLEWDPIKNQSGSYLAICPTTLQLLHSGQTLFVWQTQFHPGIGRRFKNAIITLKFSLPETSGTSLSPLKPLGVTAHAPQKAFGGTTEESKTFTWNLAIPVSGQVGAASIGVTPQASSETSKKVEHAFTITGTARGSPQKTSCVWTLEENSSSERGLPSEVQLALLVEPQGAVVYEVDVRGETGGGIYPPHGLRAKSDVKGRKVLDSSKYSGQLREYDVPDEEKLQHLLTTWTGEVEGALVSFTQLAVRP